MAKQGAQVEGWILGVKWRTDIRPQTTQPLRRKQSGVIYCGITQAKSELSSLIDEVLRGNPVVLTRSRMPVARLVVYERPDVEEGTLIVQ